MNTNHMYTISNIGSVEGTLQYNYHVTPGEPRVLLGLHGDCTERFFLKNLYCLECNQIQLVDNRSEFTYFTANCAVEANVKLIDALTIISIWFFNENKRNDSIVCKINNNGYLITVNTSRWTNVGIMLAHCLWRWANIKSILVSVLCSLGYIFIHLTCLT